MRIERHGGREGGGKPPLFARQHRNAGTQVLEGSVLTVTDASTFLLSPFQANFLSPQLLTPSTPAQYSPLSTSVRLFPHPLSALGPSREGVEGWALGRLSLPSSPMLLHQQLLAQRSNHKGCPP